MKIRICLLIAFTFIAFVLKAQQNQQLRGTVMDQSLQTPLQYATVSIPALQLSVMSDEKGMFRFKDLPVGTYRLVATNTGFKEIVLDNINVNSGKETVINISLETLVKTEKELVIKSNSRKWSYPRMSKECGLNMSNFWFIEQGQINLHLLTLKAIADAFNMEVKDFL